jgi:DNA-binding NarL/FixJ family response regulator
MTPCPASWTPETESRRTSLKVLVADDHHLVRGGMKLILPRLADAVEVLEASTVAEAIKAFESHAGIDLVLLDLSMPGARGTEGLAEFRRRCPGARIVIVSASHDLRTVQECVQRGVLGFIPKLTSPESLIGALRFVLDGGIYVPPEALTGIATEVHREIAPPPGLTPRSTGLTGRQLQVLLLLLEGKSNKQICRDMDIALGTVKGHVAAILASLGVSSRAEAIAAAGRSGWARTAGG